MLLLGTCQGTCMQLLRPARGQAGTLGSSDNLQKHPKTNRKNNHHKTWHEQTIYIYINLYKTNSSVLIFNWLAKTYFPMVMVCLGEVPFIWFSKIFIFFINLHGHPWHPWPSMAIPVGIAASESPTSAGACSRPPAPEMPGHRRQVSDGEKAMA